MDRVLLTLALVVLVLLIFGGLWWGWRNRARRQGDIPALPTVPAVSGPQLTPPLAGVYISTTRAGSWQDRVVVHGLGRRAKASLELADDGVLIDRVGEDPIFLPMAVITTVATAPGIAGKVMGMPAGVLVLTWRNGEALLDSGFRSDDPDEQDTWLAAAQAALVGHGPQDTPDGGPTAAPSRASHEDGSQEDER
ncbi:transporter [Nakamurella flavida]|uniref:Transporter n=1 Tax=Nakamurella flavida TaxID=363630 RepID=A0A939C5J9_9ACTN|nr:transporter [Nakamurella flavida]MBM9476969.1 transporter [Nakamurella flavida]MDP9779914.1 hypothetical protein [Nakamurella flavida]